MAYTQKQIDKYNRQKYINTLEKTSKNLFRMFRDEKILAYDFTNKFQALLEKLKQTNDIQLDNEYHKELQSYINRLYNDTCNKPTFDDTMLSNIREAEMSNLNRLQKLKNNVSYKKDKHKGEHQNEDWG